jgi:ABC-type Fe3+/spermidine/putrescine transport system ATPase subunit
MLAHNAGRLRSGDKAVVAVRPERVRLSANGAAEAFENALRGQVTDVIYLGQSRKYVVRLSCGAEVMALQQASAADQRGIRPGDEVSLMWRNAEANALPE